jgi:hypothetical protein
MTEPDDDGTYRAPITICWHCDRPLDAATPAGEDEGAPQPGAVSLCLYCGAVAIFGEELALRSPTKEELEDMEKDAEFRRTYLQFSWARQYVMIEQSLMRDREDPDR